MSILFMGCGEELPLDPTKEPLRRTTSTEVTSDVDEDGSLLKMEIVMIPIQNISPSATDLFGDDMDQKTKGDGVDGIDGDGDGYPSEVFGGDDCDDSDPDVYPADEDGDGSTMCDEIPDCDDSDANFNTLDEDGYYYDL